MSAIADLILGTVGRLSGRTRNRPGPRILLYHRVYSPVRDPQLLCVSEENFSAQMQALAMDCQVYPLQQLLKLNPEAEDYSKAVAITFDDGYFDNLEFAEPILRAHSLPATVFVSSGFVDSSREMWWDELERLLLGNWAFAGDQLTVLVNGEKRTWPTGGGAGASSWNVTRSAETAAQSTYLGLAGILKWLDPGQRDSLLEEIRAQLCAQDKGRDSHRGLTSDEVRAISANGVVEVGGHTCDHVALSAMARDVQVDQIRRDKSDLELLLGHKIAGFAYPYGSETDFDRTTLTEVERAGYEYACINIPSPFDARKNDFAIPRHIVRNWPAAEFSGKYRSWQGSEA